MSAPAAMNARAISTESSPVTPPSTQSVAEILTDIGFSPGHTDTGASIFVMKPDFSGGLPPDPQGDRLFLPWYMAYRASSQESQSFAKELQTDLNQVKPEWKFTLRSGPIGVLASLTMTAVAIEVGNLNDEGSLATLNDPAFQGRFSNAIVNAVSRFGQGHGGKP